MQTVMAWLASGAGAALVVLVLRDVFLTLWFPNGSGVVAWKISRGVWRLAHRSSKGPGPLVGPLATAAVLVTWGALAVIGWALVYLPGMPGAFSFGTGLHPSTRNDLVDAVYLSLVSLATLGFGDIVPTTGWLRLTVPLEALMGFVLFSASVTWILQLYSVLGRRRTLGIRLHSLRSEHAVARLGQIDSTATAGLVQDVATEVDRMRVDLGQYAQSYFFQDLPPSSVAHAIDVAVDLSEAARRHPRADVRLAGDLLESSLGSLAELLAEDFVDADGDGTEAVLRAYAADHVTERTPDAARR